MFEGEAKEYSYKTGERIRVATNKIKSTRDVIALNVAGGLDIFDDVELDTKWLTMVSGSSCCRKDAAKRELSLKLKMMVSSLNKKVSTS